jgi:cold shock CspA family protein
MPNRMIGTVAGVNRDKGFFFICGPDGRDYFAFARDLPDHRSLNTLIAQQTRIEFTPEDDPRGKGPAATDLLMIDDVPQPEDPTARRLGFGKERKS